MNKHLILIIVYIFFNRDMYSMEEYNVDMSITDFNAKFKKEPSYEKENILKMLLDKINQIKTARAELINKLEESKAWLKLQKELKSDKKYLRTSNDLGGFQEGKDFRNQLNGYKEILQNCELKLSTLPKVNSELEKKIKDTLNKFKND